VLDEMGMKATIVTATGGYAIVDEEAGHIDLLAGGAIAIWM